MATTLVIVSLFTVLLAAKATGGKLPTVREYAHRLVIARWGSEAEWRAFAEVIRRESSWDPCSHYPGVHRECGYTGNNSCGLPQANPCPSAWRGHMWETRFAQVRWAVDYMAGRYKTPTATLAYWNRHRAY